MAPAENERIAKLEAKFEHMEMQMETMGVKVDEMHSVLMQARGVRWTIVTVAGITGTISGALLWLSQHLALR